VTKRYRRHTVCALNLDFLEAARWLMKCDPILVLLWLDTFSIWIALDACVVVKSYSLTLCFRDMYACVRVCGCVCAKNVHFSTFFTDIGRLIFKISILFSYLKNYLQLKILVLASVKSTSHHTHNLHAKCGTLQVTWKHILHETSKALKFCSLLRTKLFSRNFPI
jgi:hypothetical protein